MTEPTGAGPTRHTVVVAVTAALVALALGVLGSLWLAGRSTPGDTSAEAGFARDMQTHHAQAVDMSFTMRDKTSDPALRSLTYDIATSQQQQIGQMYAWLVEWGLPQTAPGTSMDWMSDGGGHGGMGGMGTAPPTTGASGTPGMPGMASKEQLQQLATATGKEAEVLFLQLMIRHHQGGVAMAQAVLDRSGNVQVRTLASAIVAGQTSEIRLMQDLLRERGASV